jgi:hypothetical protein
MGARFGFLVEPASLSGSAGRIEPLPDHTATVKGVLGHERHHAG